MPLVVRSMSSAGPRRERSPARRATSRSMIFATRGSISWYSGSHAVSSSVTSWVISSESPRIRLSQPCLCSGHAPEHGVDRRPVAVQRGRDLRLAGGVTQRVGEDRVRELAPRRLPQQLDERRGVGDVRAVDDEAGAEDAQLGVDGRPHAVGEGRAGPLEPACGPPAGSSSCSPTSEVVLIAKSNAVRTSKRAGRALPAPTSRTMARPLGVVALAGVIWRGEGVIRVSVIELVLDDNLTSTSDHVKPVGGCAAGRCSISMTWPSPPGSSART